MPHRRTVQLLLTAAVYAAVGHAPTTAVAQQAAVPTSDVPALRQTLLDANARPEQRDQAAGRLLARTDPAAREALRDALNDKQPAVQLSAARALAARPVADASLVKPLFAALDPYSGDALIEAAGRALSAYKDDAAVLDKLAQLAASGDERVRVTAVRTLGTFVDRRAAEVLVPLAAPQQPARVSSAAASALAYLTGRPATTDWRQWWAVNQSKTPERFRADLAADRAGRFDVARGRVFDLEDALGRFVASEFAGTPGAARDEALVRFLRSPEAGVRTAGCRLARSEAADKNLAEAVRVELRSCVGDASPDVRRAAASAIALINDPAALVPLLTQLGQESESNVKAAIADALRPIGDERAVRPLLAVLDDPSPETAQFAAEALAEADTRLRESDPAAADAAAARVTEVLQARTTAQNNVELRNALVQAVGPLRSRPVANALLRMLDSPSEDGRVRRSLLAAVGAYKSPDFTDAIARRMDDPDKDTRLAAVRALGESADNAGDFAARLGDRIGPKEPSPDVRDAAWRVLSMIFPKVPKDLLGSFELKLAKEPARLLVVLREQRDRAAKAGDKDSIADRNQQIGDALLATAEPANTKEAIDAYTAALDYKRTNDKPLGDIPDSLQNALLRNRDYAKAVAFTADNVRRDSAFQDTLGSRLAKEAERLVAEEQNYAAANELVDLSLKMTPALARKTVDRLGQVRQQVQNRYKNQNRLPSSAEEGPQYAGRPARSAGTAAAG